jgi:hypothetical protein
MVEKLKTVPNELKDIFLENAQGLIKYSKFYSLNFDNIISDLKDSLNYLNKNVTISELKEKVLDNIAPFMHILKEFPKHNFRILTLENIISLVYFESEFNILKQSNT